MLFAAGGGHKDHAGAPPVLDRYQIAGCIGRGGMAEVYHGKLLRMGGFEREVAVKVLLPQLSAETEFVNMLLDEARIAATITHPNVVQVLDVGQHDEVFYLVMEYVDGIDLRSVERRHDRGRVPAEPLLYIIAEVLRGLQAIHEARDHDGLPRQIVHRDVTPSNVLITWAGSVKLADFGIAHATGRLTQTRHGAVKGKTRYMAPEQLDGRPIDWRTDLFAAGVLLLEALLGRDAADAWHSTAMGPIFKLPVRLPPGVPADLQAVLQRALAEKREERYQSAVEFRRDVVRALAARARERGADVPFSADELSEFLRAVAERPEQRRLSRPEREEPSDSLRTRPPLPPPPAPAPPLPASSGATPTPPLPLLSSEGDVPTTLSPEPLLDGPDPERQVSQHTLLDRQPPPGLRDVRAAATQSTAVLPIIPGGPTRSLHAVPLPPTLTGETTEPAGPLVGGRPQDFLADDPGLLQANTVVTASRPAQPDDATPPPIASAATLRPRLAEALAQDLGPAHGDAGPLGEGRLARASRHAVAFLRATAGEVQQLPPRMLAMAAAGLTVFLIGVVVIAGVLGRSPPPPPPEPVAVPDLSAAAPPPPPATGRLQIAAPPGTRVIIDGVAQPEPAPGGYELAPGPHKIRLQAPRRREQTRTIEIQVGRTELVKM
jgi:serine/threonine-protein kinase